MIVVLGVLAFLILLATVLAGPTSHANVFLVYRRKSFLVLAATVYVAFWIVYAVVSRDHWRMNLARCALATVTVLMMIGVLECLALLKLVNYPKALGTLTGFQTWQDSRWWKYDPELVHVRWPHLRITGKTTGDACYRIGAPTDHYYVMDVQYDANGFRNSRDYQQADVVVIGDSFVEAGLIAAEHTAVGRLAERLDATVANLGVSAYGPQQEEIVHRRYATPLKPKIVVWVFFDGNDLRDVVVYPWRKSIEDPEFTQESLIDRSFSWNALSAVARLTSGWVKTGRRRSGRFISSQGSDERLYFVYDGKPLSDEDLANLETAFESIEQAHQRTQETQATFLLVFAPTKFRVYDQLCEFPDDAVCNVWKSNELPERIRGECQSRGIEFLDLTPALRAAAENGELVYFTDDTHWNERGNAIAADAIGEWIETHRASASAEY